MAERKNVGRHTYPCCAYRFDTRVVRRRGLEYNLPEYWKKSDLGDAVRCFGMYLSSRQSTWKTMEAIRVGIGHDTHRLRPGGPIRLGGVDIPHNMELVGHSDADALIHAVVDALLGAVALGDVGQMFPDTDPANKARDSAEMLEAAYEAVTQLGWRIGNIDCIVFAQRPKLLPHRQTIRMRLAEILGIDMEQVSLKGKTGEHIGPIGKEEAIAAQCVALLISQ